MSIIYKIFLNIKRLFGPWAIEPTYLGGLTFFLVASLYALGPSSEHSYFTAQAALRPLISSVIALLTYFQLRIMSRAFPKYQRSLWLYVLLLTIQSFSIWSWIVLFRNLIPEIQPSYLAYFSPIPLLRFLFALGCANAVIGLVQDRLSKALAEREENLKIVEAQSKLLLQNDENTRSQLSDFLHDKVQSSLVTACFELQDISSRLDDDLRSELVRVIEKLEKLRAADVRNAAQTLTPPLGNIDLRHSLLQMSANYSPQLNVTIEITEAVEQLHTESTKEIFLGIYRIVEQALLNATIHGHAENANITMELMGSSISLVIENDGEPIPELYESGLGSAITDSWVRTLNGSWKLENHSHGVKVSASIPMPQ